MHLQLSKAMEQLKADFDEKLVLLQQQMEEKNHKDVELKVGERGPIYV
jgi:hypothetical protein